MRCIALILSLFACCNATTAINGKDSISGMLDAFVVSVDRNISPIKGTGMQGVSMDMDFMHRLPKILGNADPMRYSQLLPGIQTNAEYDAGLHIHGCENSHNMISISGVPIYNAAHMLGFFSTFNASHFSKMTIRKQVTASDAINRIGGVLDMVHHDSIPPRINGDFSVGLMSSQGTVRIPSGKRSALTASARISYLNMLYGSFLEIDGSMMEYSFSDINVTYLNKIDRNNTLYIDFYTGGDKVLLKDNASELYHDTSMEWGNMAVAAHWECGKGDTRIRSSLYYTGYDNRMRMKGKYEIGLPSGIYDFGYKLSAYTGKFQWGVNLVDHHISPQAPEYGSYTIVRNDVPVQHASELSAYAGCSGVITGGLCYVMALKGDIYRNEQDDYVSSSLNPSISLAYNKKRVGELMLVYSRQHQYLHNTGFTNIGFPVEFWFGSDGVNKPQRAHNVQLLYKKEFCRGKYVMDLGVYYKKLYNQIEYNSSPLDLLNKEYDLDANLLHGKGYNYGVNVSINKCTGPIIGWIAYSYGRAKRKFEQLGDRWFPANHERIHEFNGVATYRLNGRMDVGANVVFATGAPYTAPKYFYIINGNVITEFGDHNANRLKSYLRLDVSFNYDMVKRTDKTAGINVSLYNALFMANRIYYRFKAYDGRYALRGVSFLTRMLPSISYYYRF